MYVAMDDISAVYLFAAFCESHWRFPEQHTQLIEAHSRVGMIPVAPEELHTDAACKCIAPSAHKWCTIVCTVSVVAPRGAAHTHGAAQGVHTPHRGVHSAHRGVHNAQGGNNDGESPR